MEATRFDITLRGVQKYSIGLLCALVAILLGHLFRPVLGREGPFLWAMVAILFAAYFAGWGPALLAIAVMTFHLAWTLGHASIHPGLYDEILPLVVFVPVALGMTAFLVSRNFALAHLRESNILLQHLLQREQQDARDLASALSRLQRSEQRYRIVAHVTDDALFEWDPATQKFEWTDGLTRVFGHKPEDVRSDMDWWQAKLHPDDRVRVIKSFHRAIGSAEDTWSEDFRFRRADGEYAHVVCRARIQRGLGTVAEQVNGAMMDVTEQRRAERVLARNQRFLRQMLRSLPIPVMLLDSNGRVTLQPRQRATERLPPPRGAGPSPGRPFHPPR